MKLLILGGGHCQLNAILRAKNQGHTLIVSDYYDDAPGKNFCTHKELISTFDIDGNIQVAKKHNIDGILTLGTDQPVYTAARVQDALDLPKLIDVPTSKAVTNKKVMKTIFKENNIPTTNFAFIKKNFCENELSHLNFPIVIKPLDSQGQRGIYKLDSIEEIKKYLDSTLSYSREEEILVEEYYENDEITVSGWVENDNVHVLTVTDRVTYDNYPHIGVCTAHNFPSKHLYSNFTEIMKITEDLVESFKIHNGPIYFQMLVGKAGIKVNEIACRIGGAYEDIFIPLLTGVDILDMLINASLGKKLDYTALRNYDLSKNSKTLSVQLLFAKPGVVKTIEAPFMPLIAPNREDYFGDSPLNYPINSSLQPQYLPGVKALYFNIKPGDNIKPITNATQRIGYMIVEGNDYQDLCKNLDRAFDNLKIYDNKGNNLVIKFDNY